MEVPIPYNYKAYFSGLTKEFLMVFRYLPLISPQFIWSFFWYSPVGMIGGSTRISRV